MTLVEFLTARLDEDEQVARDAVRWSWGAAEWAEDGEPDWIHIARHDPARVLRDVEAKRRIVERHSRDPYWADSGLYKNACAGCGSEGPCESPRYDVDECPELQDLATVYADHPDCREEWRP